jgi:Uncharacterized conserved protein
MCILWTHSYFLIYDTDTQKSVFLDNSAAASTGGAGIKAAQMIADNKVNILLTPRLGEKMLLTYLNLRKSKYIKRQLLQLRIILMPSLLESFLC